MPRKPSPPPTLSPPLSSRRRILHSPSSSTPSAPKPTKRKPRGLHTRLPSGANASKWCELADILDGMVDICSDSSDSSSSSSVNGDGDGAWEEEGDGDGLQAWSGGGKDDDIDVWHPPPPPQRPSGIKIMRAERVPEPEPEPEPELAAAVSPIGHEVFLTTARYQQEVFHRTEVTEVELVREVVVEECGYYRHQYRQHMEAVEFQRTRTTAATETTHLAWNYVRTRVREKMSETVRGEMDTRCTAQWSAWSRSSATNTVPPPGPSPSDTSNRRRGARRGDRSPVCSDHSDDGTESPTTSGWERACSHAPHSHAPHSHHSHHPSVERIVPMDPPAPPPTEKGVRNTLGTIAEWIMGRSKG